MKRLLPVFGLLLALLVYAISMAATHSDLAGSPPFDAMPTLGMPGTQDQTQALYQQALARLDQRLLLFPLDHEASLLKGLIQFRSGMLDEAVQQLSELTRREPNFHLAHLILGDLHLASAHVLSDIGNAPLFDHSQDKQQELAQLRKEANVRLRAYLNSLPQGRLPSALLLMDEAVHTALVVDKHNHRLYVYERGDDGLPHLLRDLYVSTGRANGNKNIEGDLRTPEGVYFITRHIPGSQLPDLYGYGAWPMNYPNEWDRRLGKTGHGIWLHGTEQIFYSRPPLDSEGCVVLPNIDLQSIKQYLHPGSTPIIVADQVEWLELAEWTNRRNGIQQAIAQWRDDWASNDTEAYLSHYSERFWSRGHDYRSWLDYKRRVASGKQWQQVELDALSLFGYPREASNGKQVVVANFRQRYDSNNFRSSMNKRLYLVEEGGQWRIMYEGGQ
ncbi:MAG: L,D-transpeptidase family protein [Thiohalomonadaceae bacterium]